MSNWNLKELTLSQSGIIPSVGNKPRPMSAINSNVVPAVSGEKIIRESEMANMEYFLNQAIERNHRWQTQYMINISTNGTLTVFTWGTDFL